MLQLGEYPPSCYVQSMPQWFKSTRQRAASGRLLSSCWILTASLASAQASPVDGRLSLEWSAPSGCPTSEQVRADLHSLLVRSRRESPEPIAVTVTISPSHPRAYRLILISNGNARELQSDSCTQLAQAAALMMALMLDPGLDLKADPDAATIKAAAPPPPPLPITRAATNAHAAPAAPSMPPRSPGLVGSMDVAGRVEVGAWPTWNYGAVLGVGLGIANWRFSTRVGLGSTVRLDAGQGARLEFVPITLGLESGYSFPFRAWSIEPRLGVELGVNRSRAFELETAKRTTLSLAAIAMARVNRRIANMQIWLGVGSALPVWRPRWMVGGVALHELGIALRTELGLEGSF